MTDISIPLLQASVTIPRPRVDEKNATVYKPAGEEGLMMMSVSHGLRCGMFLLGLVVSIPAGLAAQNFNDIGGRLLQKAASRVVDKAGNERQRDPRELIISDHVAETGDNWKLVVRRYSIPAMLDPQRPPVILCHGFGYNSRFFDLRADVSLARYLAQNGFDVWVADLRGCGRSNKWVVTVRDGKNAMIDRFVDEIGAAKVPESGFVSLDPRFFNWTFDDHVTFDIPTILSLVTQTTRSSQVAWIGHSMGGNAMLCWLGQHPNDRTVVRLVTVGSQVTMPNGQLVIHGFFELLNQRQRQAQRQPTNIDTVVRGLSGVFFNEANTDPQIVATLAQSGQDAPSIGQLQQYIALCQTGRLSDARGVVDYASAVSQIQCPYLIVGGDADQVAPRETQEFLYRNVASPDRTLLMLGRRSGMSADYGHNDSLIGWKAGEEVYPQLARWLAGQPIQNNVGADQAARPRADSHERQPLSRMPVTQRAIAPANSTERMPREPQVPVVPPARSERFDSTRPRSLPGASEPPRSLVVPGLPPARRPDPSAASPALQPSRPLRIPREEPNSRPEPRSNPVLPPLELAPPN